MRVAVCLSGEMKGFGGLEYLSNYVIQPFALAGHKVDTFVHTRNNTESWPCYFPCRVFCVERDEPIDGDAPQRLLQQYWSLARVGKLVIQTEQREGRYNLVVRTRPDCWINAPLKVETLLDGKIHVPRNETHPYEVDGKRVETVCDKFAVGPSVEMQLYLNKFKDIRTFCEKYPIQGEAFTAWSLAGQVWVPGGRPTPWVRDGNIEIVEAP